MAVIALLTRKLVEGLSFERQIVHDTKGGLKTIQTPSTVKEWSIRDKDLEGFSVRCTSKTIGWYVRKRMGDLGDVRRCMGDISTLSAENARKRARVWLGMMQNGVDPLQEKKDRIKRATIERVKSTRTLAACFEEYVGRKTAKSKSNTTKDRLKVSKWMQGSPIWTKSIFDINDDDVEQSLGPLRDAALKGDPKPAWGPKSISPATLQKIYVYVSSAYMREALQYRILLSKNDGPFVRWRADQAIPRPQSKTTHLPTETEVGQGWLKELVALHQKAHHPDVLLNRPDPRGTGIKPHTSVLVDFFLCVLLWGSRKEETAKLKWTDVKFEDRLVIFPESMTKSGKAGVAPLTPWAVEILQARKRANERWRPDEPSPWVFPSRQHGKAIANPRGIAELLAEETGLMIMPHDLRRTLATYMNKVSLKEEEVGKLLLVGAALNHSRGNTGGQVSAATIGYIQEQVEVLRPAYQARENQFRRMVGLPILAAAEVEEATHTEGTIESVIAMAKADPELKRKLLEAMLK